MEEHSRRVRLSKISPREKCWIWIGSLEISKNFEIAQSAREVVKWFLVCEFRFILTYLDSGMNTKSDLAENNYPNNLCLINITKIKCNN